MAARSLQLKIASISDSLRGFSQYSERTGCGSAKYPWLVSGRPGQRVDVSLVSFEPTRGGGTPVPALCQVLAVLRDDHGGGGDGDPKTFCRGEGTHAARRHLSRTHRVQIRLMTRQPVTSRRSPAVAMTSHAAAAAKNDSFNFLVKYEGG